eukprot:3210055-Rhodomonas_salina.2
MQFQEIAVQFVPESRLLPLIPHLTVSGAQDPRGSLARTLGYRARRTPGLLTYRGRRTLGYRARRMIPGGARSPHVGHRVSGA